MRTPASPSALVVLSSSSPLPADPHFGKAPVYPADGLQRPVQPADLSVCEPVRQLRSRREHKDFLYVLPCSGFPGFSFHFNLLVSSLFHFAQSILPSLEGVLLPLATSLPHLIFHIPRRVADLDNQLSNQHLITDRTAGGLVSSLVTFSPPSNFGPPPLTESHRWSPSSPLLSTSSISHRSLFGAPSTSSPRSDLFHA